MLIYSTAIIVSICNLVSTWTSVGRFAAPAATLPATMYSLNRLFIKEHLLSDITIYLLSTESGISIIIPWKLYHGRFIIIHGTTRLLSISAFSENKRLWTPFTSVYFMKERNLCVHNVVVICGVCRACMQEWSRQ